MADAWDPVLYLRFADERTRPAVELVSRIQCDSPRTIVDLGCGPGNSTTVLKRRWPGALVIGVDNSPEMIEKACDVDPRGEWCLADAAAWTPNEPFDVVFSNATLQWLPDHGRLVARLFGHVADQGVLAFQIPARAYALVSTLIDDVAGDPAWAASMVRPRSLLTMERLTFYYDLLAPHARSVDAWETEYQHVMGSHEAIVEWIASTGLRPYLEALDTDAERQRFTAMLLERVRESYEIRSDGTVLLPFRRLFVVACK
jgi:trans-aconitate 2-methyltransferase